MKLKSKPKGDFNSDNNLEIDDYSWFHIEEVHLFTGEDDGGLTDYVIYKTEEAPSGHKLTREVPEDFKEVKVGRHLRGEIGVKIVLKSEGGRFKQSISFCHHKGNVIVDVREFPVVLLGPNNE